MFSRSKLNKRKEDSFMKIFDIVFLTSRYKSSSILSWRSIRKNVGEIRLLVDHVQSVGKTRANRVCAERCGGGRSISRNQRYPPSVSYSQINWPIWRYTCFCWYYFCEKRRMELCSPPRRSKSRRWATSAALARSSRCATTSAWSTAAWAQTTVSWWSTLASWHNSTSPCITTPFRRCSWSDASPTSCKSTLSPGVCVFLPYYLHRIQSKPLYTISYMNISTNQTYFYWLKV